MGLEDFEKELAASKDRSTSERESRPDRSHKSKDKHRDEEHRRHRHRHHHHRSHRHDDDDQRRGSKRVRDEERDGGDRREKRHRSDSPADAIAHPQEVKVFDSDPDDAEDEWVEKEASGVAPPEEEILDLRDQNLGASAKPQRDAWMREPSALDIDYVQSRRAKTPPGQFVAAKNDHELKVHKHHINQHLADLQKDLESDDEDSSKPELSQVQDKPAQHEVSYTFGDNGSSWRMTKLKAVYRQAKELGKSVDEVALERYGDFQDFDDAREEERELDRRRMYGKDYVGLEKPSGEFYQERKMQAGIRRQTVESPDPVPSLPQGEILDERESQNVTVPLDQTALNKLKAQMMKAKLRGAPNAKQLEEEYELASKASLANQSQSDVIVLDRMDTRMLAGGRSGEVTTVDTKRGRERGLVVEKEDMTIEDMVRHERRTRGAHGGEGRAFAERIARDSKFVNDLDYMDDNATNLSKKVVKSDSTLRNVAIEDFQKMQRVLDSCPLCHHEESGQPPVAPVVSLATRTYLTLPTEPELTKHGAVIVPIQHRLNLLECDEDEWEEIRNFMKSLSRFYHAQDRGVIFYENAAFMTTRKGHAALHAVPLPHHLADTAPAYFKEAILASDEQWSQHKPIIDTLALAQKPGFGKAAFRKAMVKEMPYFHVFFSLSGGMGHVIEDERRWPKGDLFAREIIGGILDRAPEAIKKQGRWARHDQRLQAFRKKWDDFDWTKVLMDAQ